LLLTTKKENIYRHSFSAEYYIYDLEKSTLTPLSENGKQQLATFSPDGKKVAFVRSNNLFWKDLESNQENQLTFDGEYNKIINGAPDWVYEEEFGFNKAFVWSTDSKKIGYYRFDERHVKQFNMTMYEGLYPEWYQFKYPKAGERNAIVTIHVVNLETNNSIRMDIGPEEDQYIPRIKWTRDPDLLSIIRLNRLQNHVEVLHGDATTGETEVVYEEKEDKYVSEATDQMITYINNNEEFLLLSEREGWMMIYLYNFLTKELSSISDAGYDIHSLLGFDEKTNKVYYSSHERGSLYLDTYSIRIDGKKKKLITKRKGWNETEFSNGFKYFINKYSTINTPPVISLHSKGGMEIRILENNRILAELMKSYNFSTVEFFNFKTTENIELAGYMIKPSDFDPSKEYPLFMYVYGGPESQNVQDRFSSHRGAWFQYLTQQGYIVACVDNRGTNARGEEFRKSTYLELGKYETIDQIEAAKYLGDLEYVDEQRIGIFGWSYGGFMSLNCLFKGPDVFRMAISVAPVTNWRYYDTIYTERFMRTPQENPDGYDRNSPILFTDQMKGKLLLIHGMGDDNVHFQNSTELVKALVKSNKQFDSQFYPNKNHGIYGGNTTYHLYTRMTDFVLENL
jgi:dipeptidyl-peptidase-4